MIDAHIHLDQYEDHVVSSLLGDCRSRASSR